jgi:hypothetical protein
MRFDTSTGKTVTAANRADAAATAQRGGKRLGAGRKAVDGATGVVQICITIRPDQRQMLARLGGSAWVRSAIDSAAKVVDK